MPKRCTRVENTPFLHLSLSPLICGQNDGKREPPRPQRSSRRSSPVRAGAAVQRLGAMSRRSRRPTGGSSNLNQEERQELPASRAASRTSTRRGDARSASVELPDIYEVSETSSKTRLMSD